MRRGQGRRARPAQRHHLGAGRDRALDASRYPRFGQESIEGLSPDPGARDDRHHPFAMAAEHHRLHVGDPRPGLLGQSLAKPGAVQRPGHAQHPFARKLGGQQHLRRHLVEGVGDHQHHRRRRRGPDGFGDRPDRAPVRLQEIGPAHARSACTARGDDHDLRAGDERGIGPARRAARRAGHAAGVVQIERHRFRKPRYDVHQGDRPRHAGVCRQMRHPGADPSHPGDRDAFEKHGVAAGGRLRGDPFRAAAVQPAHQGDRAVRPCHDRALEGARAQRDPQPGRRVARLVGDDAAGQHLDVPAAVAARPLHVLGSDDAARGVHRGSLPSTAPMAPTAAAIASCTDTSLPETKKRPYRPTARTSTTSISAAFSASLAASAT